MLAAAGMNFKRMINILKKRCFGLFILSLKCLLES
jgi:hypothetical protein